MKTIEDMAREAGAIPDGADFGEDYAFRVSNHILTSIAELVRAQALDEAAATALGFVWFDAKGCAPDGAPPFIAAAILALKERA